MKTLLILFINVTLILASFESEYAELIKKEEANIITGIFRDKNFLTSKQKTELLTSKWYFIIEQAKNKQAGGYSDTAWNIVKDIGVYYIEIDAELIFIVNNSKNESKVVDKKDKIRKGTIKLWEDLKVLILAGRYEAVRKLQREENNKIISQLKNLILKS